MRLSQSSVSFGPPLKLAKWCFSVGVVGKKKVLLFYFLAVQAKKTIFLFMDYFLSIVYDTWYRNQIIFVFWHLQGFFSITASVRPWTSLTKTSTSSIPRTFVLPPSGLVTAASSFPRLLSQFLFNTMWPVLPESTTRSCSVASLEALSDLRLHAKLPGSELVAFLTHACPMWCLFCIQRTLSFFYFSSLCFLVAFFATAIAC